MAYETTNFQNRFSNRSVSAEDIDLGIRNGRRLRAEVMRGAFDKLRHNILRSA